MCVTNHVGSQKTIKKKKETQTPQKEKHWAYFHYTATKAYKTAEIGRKQIHND